jgi:thiol-disulfide isomerase/thioredoxin
LFVYLSQGIFHRDVHLAVHHATQLSSGLPMKVFSARIAIAAIAVAITLIPGTIPAQNQQYNGYNYGHNQQNYQRQRVQPLYSVFGARQVQPGQQAGSWYQAPAQASKAGSGKAATSRKTKPTLKAENRTATKRNETSKRTPAKAAVSTSKRSPSKANASSSKSGSAPKKLVSKPNNNAWLTSFEAGRTKANQQGRPLVVLFVHRGCPECERMDSNLAQPGAKTALASAVKVRIEFTENAVVVNRFGVKLTPTFLVLKPDGGEAYREVGALTVDRMRQIQPALESLVAAPPAAEVEKKLSYSPKEGSAPAEDSTTSQTVAAL